MEEEETTVKTILPPSCVVEAVRWSRKSGRPFDSIQPQNSLDGYLFLHQWGSPCSCGGTHQRSLAILAHTGPQTEHFWWTSMSSDVREFITACSIYARNKPSHQPPAGPLQPLPIPHRPWSCISVNFITGLPPSDGNTTILTITDCFSKMTHLFPLPKLP